MDSNKYLPQAVTDLVEELNKLPTIGRKSAQRLAFYLLRQNSLELDNLAAAVLGIKENVKFCSKCFNLTSVKESDTGLCKICTSQARNQNIICVVEEVLDLIAIENTMEYSGVYHVLHGALSPLDGVGPNNLKLKELFDMINNSKDIEELILATSTNSEGEATALYIYENLKNSGVKISRIASGLPIGGDLDYADEGTLRRALKGRVGF